MLQPMSPTHSTWLHLLRLHLLLRGCSDDYSSLSAVEAKGRRKSSSPEPPSFLLPSADRGAERDWQRLCPGESLWHGTYCKYPPAIGGRGYKVLCWPLTAGGVVYYRVKPEHVMGNCPWKTLCQPRGEEGEPRINGHWFVSSRRPVPDIDCVPTMRRSRPGYAAGQNPRRASALQGTSESERTLTLEVVPPGGSRASTSNVASTSVSASAPVRIETVTVQTAAQQPHAEQEELDDVGLYIDYLLFDPSLGSRDPLRSGSSPEYPPPT